MPSSSSVQPTIFPFVRQIPVVSSTRSTAPRVRLISFILAWPTYRTPAVGGLIVCPKTCRHIARRMMTG